MQADGVDKTIIHTFGAFSSIVSLKSPNTSLTGMGLNEDKLTTQAFDVSVPIS